MPRQSKFNWTEEIQEVTNMVSQGMGIYQACKERGYSYTIFRKNAKDQLSTLKQAKKQSKNVKQECHAIEEGV